MRLMLSVGYQKLLFGEGAEVGKIIASLDGAQLVKESGYGDTKKLSKDSGSIEVELIPDGSAILPEVQDGFHDQLIKVTEQASKLQTEVYTLTREKKKVEDELAGLRAAINKAAPAEPQPSAVAGTKTSLEF